MRLLPCDSLPKMGPCEHVAGLLSAEGFDTNSFEGAPLFVVEPGSHREPGASHSPDPGSHSAAVTTSSYFNAGQRVHLSGAVEPSVVADAAGRIIFNVDLGPKHAVPQYAPGQRAVEALGGYFTSKVVEFFPQ